MPHCKLTDTNIERLPLTDTGTVFYIDEQNKKFQLAVGKRKRTFYAIGHLHGRNLRKKLGEWPYVRAKKARGLAEEFIGEISKGNDPRRVKAETLENVLDQYIETRMHASRGTLSENTADQYRRALTNHCQRWFKRDISTITFEDVKALHHRLREKPYMANQVVRALRALFSEAGCPMKFPKGFFYPERARTNRIHDLTDFFEKVAEIENPSKQAFWQIGAYTGIRRDTLLALDWSQVNINDGTIHLQKMKNGLARTMPVSRQVVAILEAQRRLSDEWVFPSFKGDMHLVDVRDSRIRARPHDLRRTFTEAAGSLLLPDYAIDYLRGDTMKSTAHKYMTRLNVESFREPVQRIADYLDGFNTLNSG